MYNYFLLIGKVSEKPVVEELKDGKRKCVIKLSVARSFMDYQGERVSDVLEIQFCDFMIDFIEDNIKKGNMVMVKGRMQATEQGIELIGEKIMFFNQA